MNFDLNKLVNANNQLTAIKATTDKALEGIIADLNEQVKKVKAPHCIIEVPEIGLMEFFIAADVNSSNQDVSVEVTGYRKSDAKPPFKINGIAYVDVRTVIRGKFEGGKYHHYIDGVRREDGGEWTNKAMEWFYARLLRPNIEAYETLKPHFENAVLECGINRIRNYIEKAQYEYRYMKIQTRSYS